jgi:hypothetical protein
VSQERCPRMLAEQIDPADVAAQRVEALMPADLGELEHRRARLGRAVIRKCHVGHAATERHGAEHRPALLISAAASLHRLDGRSR